jgi:hypothetical protein
LEAHCARFENFASISACGVVVPQVAAVDVLCVLAIPAKLFLVRHFGVEAMLLGFSAIYLVTLSIMYGLVYRRNITSIFRREAKACR